MAAKSVALAVVFAQILHVYASVTVYYQYGQHPLESTTTTAAAADYTGAAAYDPTVLNPPPPPNPPIPTQFAIQLQNGGTPGVSIAQHGAFFGFSIEMSVVDQVCECIVPYLTSRRWLTWTGGRSGQKLVRRCRERAGSRNTERSLTRA